MLKVLGKYIEQSGLDKIFVEAGVYGNTTLKQILEGKHMKRAVEGHTTMYLALFRLYFVNCYEQNSALFDNLDDVQSELFFSFKFTL